MKYKNLADLPRLEKGDRIAVNLSRFKRAWGSLRSRLGATDGQLAKQLGFAASADLFLLRRHGSKRAVKTVYALALAEILGNQILEDQP